jgi:hypothetical protein
MKNTIYGEMEMWIDRWNQHDNSRVSSPQALSSIMSLAAVKLTPERRAIDIACGIAPVALD